MNFQQKNDVIQMFPQGIGSSVKTHLGRFISLLILKPTYVCNADCDYCYTPPKNENRWDFEKFKKMFDRLEPVLTHYCTIMWHGGEPMMMNPEFYDKCCDYIKTKLSHPNFEMQTNITRYSSKKWKPLFEKHFKSEILTSYDADEIHRTINGDPALYAKRFKDGFKTCLDDGFRCGLVSVIDRTNKHSVNDLIDYVLATDAGRGKVHIDIDAMEACGRKEDDGTILSNIEYADVLISMLERWNYEKLNLSIEPLTTLLSGFLNGSGNSRCGNDSSCAMGILIMDNDGSISSCEELKEVARTKDEYIYGNILTDSLDKIFTSKAHSIMASRSYNMPLECAQCDAFMMCKGGCPRFVLQKNNDISDIDPRCDMFKKIYAQMVKMNANGELEWSRKFLPNRF